MEDIPLLGKSGKSSITTSSSSSQYDWLCCCGKQPRLRWGDVDATASQKARVAELKTTVQEKYDAKKETHRKLWKELWSLLSTTTANYPGDVGTHWVDLGFQQSNPSSDLRGAGIVGLKHLINFVRCNVDFSRSVLQKYPNFPFCVAGLNASHCLFYHLQLYRGRTAVPPYGGSLQNTTTFFAIGEGEDRRDLVCFLLMIDRIGYTKSMQKMYSCAFYAIIEGWQKMADSDSASVLDLLRFNSVVLPCGWKAAESLLLNDRMVHQKM
jgi:hypothetical protein